MMCFGIILIASLGAAGVLSAIAATYPLDQLKQNPKNYLIGTSVSCRPVCSGSSSRCEPLAFTVKLSIPNALVTAESVLISGALLYTFFKCSWLPWHCMMP